jgi:hypothetical protein
MRHETDAKPESHKPDRFYFYVSVLVVPSILAAFVGLLLVNFVVVLAGAANYGRAVGDCFGLLILLGLNYQLVIRLVFSLVAGGGIQFVGLLLELLALLRAAGLV